MRRRDLIIVDNGAGGTEVKCAMSRVLTYAMAGTLSEAAQKLMTWFSFLTSEQNLAPQKEVEVEPIAQNDVILIEELQLPVRAYNCLKRAGINSVDDLVNYSQEEIREIKNFGKKSAQEVFQALKDKFDIVLPSLNS